MQAGALTINVTAVEASSLLTEVLAAVEPLAANKHILVERDLAADVGQIRCDAQRIFQVLFNLCNNAIQYVAPRGRIAVQVQRVSGAIQFTVRDNGCGIPAERLSALFKRFSKGEAGQNGLGLYIAKSLVEAHGGKIWVESREGEGSTFFFTLPA